jgi:hypothetical protein
MALGERAAESTGARLPLTARVDRDMLRRCPELCTGARGLQLRGAVSGP